MITGYRHIGYRSDDRDLVGRQGEAPRRDCPRDDWERFVVRVSRRFWFPLEPWVAFAKGEYVRYWKRAR